MTMRTLVGRAGILLALAGCAVGPSTHVPVATPAPLPAIDTSARPGIRRFIDSLAVARQGEQKDSGVATLWNAAPLTLDSAGDVAWLSVLRDSTLVGLVNTAVANNRELRIAVGRVREFRALHGVGKSDLYPQILANGNAST